MFAQLPGFQLPRCMGRSISCLLERGGGGKGLPAPSPHPHSNTYAEPVYMDKTHEEHNKLLTSVRYKLPPPAASAVWSPLRSWFFSTASELPWSHFINFTSFAHSNVQKQLAMTCFISDDVMLRHICIFRMRPSLASCFRTLPFGTLLSGCFISMAVMERALPTRGIAAFFFARFFSATLSAIGSNFRFWESCELQAEYSLHNTFRSDSLGFPTLRQMSIAFLVASLTCNAKIPTKTVRAGYHYLSIQWW